MAITAVIAFAVLVVAFGPGAVRPEIIVGADGLVLARAELADRALADLQSELGEALDEGRAGAASIVAGSEPPGPRLRDASALVLGAAETADRVDTALASLAGARAARGDVDAQVPEGTSAAELSSIAAQLEATVAPADEFATMRRWAATVPQALDAALAALANGDVSEAEAQVAAARRAHDAVASWEVDFATLPIWIETSDATIDAVDRIVAAVRAGQAAEARRLAEAFASLADEASRADRALQITISEDGGLVAAAPLSRLAAARRAVDAQRAAVGDLLARERRASAAGEPWLSVYSTAAPVESA